MTISRSCAIVFSIFTSIFANASNTLDRYKAAKILAECGEYDDAISLWEEALRLDPQLQNLSKKIYRRLGDVLVLLKRWEPAFGYYTLALEKEGEVPLNTLQDFARVCIEMASLELRDSGLEAAQQYHLFAKKYFEMFLARNTQPISVPLAVNISRVYYLVGEYEKSARWHQATFELALQTNSKLPEIFFVSFSNSINKKSYFN